MIPHLYAKRGEAITECGLMAVIPREVTTEPEEARCPDCRRSMIASGECPECGEHRLSWSPHPKKLTTVVDGRLTMNDVTAVFYLACDWCSATLIPEVDLETVARFLTERRYLP